MDLFTRNKVSSSSTSYNCDSSAALPEITGQLGAQATLSYGRSHLRQHDKRVDTDVRSFPVISDLRDLRLLNSCLPGRRCLSRLARVPCLPPGHPCEIENESLMDSASPVQPCWAGWYTSKRPPASTQQGMSFCTPKWTKTPIVCHPLQFCFLLDPLGMVALLLPGVIQGHSPSYWPPADLKCMCCCRSRTLWPGMVLLLGAVLLSGLCTVYGMEVHCYSSRLAERLTRERCKRAISSILHVTLGILESPNYASLIRQGSWGKLIELW